MATAEIIVSESLSRNQKAIQRANGRRAHAQGLRAQIQYVRDEYRLAKKILNESYHDDLDQIATDYPQRDEAPVRPARHHGKAPTPYALYCYLSAHAEWESRSGQALRRMLQDNHEKDLQDLLADALAQIAGHRPVCGCSERKPGVLLAHNRSACRCRPGGCLREGGVFRKILLLCDANPGAGLS